MPAGIYKRKSLAERLNSNSKQISSGCWQWTASVYWDGYGQIGLNGKKLKAHRVSYEQYKGTIPSGMQVLHKCDNRRCVNPDHLFLGTLDDNMKDMVAKKRSPHGTRNGMSKLNESLVLLIRSACGTQQKIAGLFGISQSQVSTIKAKKQWVYV